MESGDKQAETFENFLEIVKTDKSLPKSIGEINRNFKFDLVHRLAVTEPNLMRRYFKVTDNDSAKALEIFKSNLALRHKGPQIFSERDALSKQIQDISKIV
jgi:hypothetical protein